MASRDESTQVKVIDKGEEDESTQVKVVDKGENEQPSLPIDLQPQPGYDHVFVDPVPSENYCGICLLVVRDPVQVSLCGHLFCGACLDYWITRCEESEDRELTCPSDNNVITKEDIFRDRNKERYILNLRVFCDNKPFGCTATPDLRHHESHLKDCKSRAAPCPLLCGQDVVDWALNLHVEEECPKRQTICRKCGEMVEEERLWEHPTVCSMEEVTCDYCSHVIVHRHQIIDHYGRCREFPVHCTFREFGCHDEMRRREMSEHEAVLVQQHMVLMMKSVTCLQNDLTATKSDLTTTKDELNTTKDKLDKAMDELNAKCAENKKLTEDLKEQHDKSVEKIDKNVEKNKQELLSRITELSEDTDHILPFSW